MPSPMVAAQSFSSAIASALAGSFIKAAAIASSACSSAGTTAWGRCRKRNLKHAKDYWRPESSGKA